MSEQNDSINGSSWSSWLSSVAANFQAIASEITEPSPPPPTHIHNDDGNTSTTPSSVPASSVLDNSALDTSALDTSALDSLNSATVSGTPSISAAAISTNQQSPYTKADPTGADRQDLWQKLYASAGMDLVKMRLSLPIWLFEPTTALTRMAETFQFSDLLDRAAGVTDPIHRDSLVASFVVSAFAHTERVRKPFNPVLGETFEFINTINNMRFYAEQVSHHPPISASRAEGNGWVAGEVVNMHATFQGNSVEIRNSGTRYIHLTETGDEYTWNMPKAHVSNLFIGGTYVDHHGDFEIKNNTTKTVSRLSFAKSGWFFAGRYDVTGELLDPKGEKLVNFRGAWNRYLDSFPVTKESDPQPTNKAKTETEGANRLWMAGSHLLTEEEGGGDTGVLANCTKFTKRTLESDTDYASELPPTDSRLRPDRIALENGDHILAAEEKSRIEQLQRERRSIAVQHVENGGKPKVAAYFQKVGDGENMWEATGSYWTASRTFMDDDEKRGNASLW